MWVFITTLLSAPSFSRLYVVGRAAYCRSLFHAPSGVLHYCTNIRRKRPGEQCAHICAICAARLPARKSGTHFYLYLPSPPLRFVGVRGKGDVNSSFIEVSAQKRMWCFCFCTLTLNTKNTSHVCLRSKCRTTSCRAFRSWCWMEHRTHSVRAGRAMMSDGVGMFSQLTAHMFERPRCRCHCHC